MALTTAQRRKRYKESLFLFANEVVESYRPANEPNDLCERENGPHKKMCRFIEDTEWGFGEHPITRTMLLAPRGYYKSALGVENYVLWRLARDPNDRILIISSGAQLAKLRLARIRTQCQFNKRLLSLFPHMAPMDIRKGWGATAARIMGADVLSSRQHSIECMGVGCKLAGNHYKCVILDDVVTENDVISETGLEKTINWCEKLTPVLEKGGHESHLRVFGTRWHVLDYYGHILELCRRTQGKRLRVPWRTMVFGVYDENGDSIWPEVYPNERLNEIRLSFDDENDWANQYLNEVIARKNQLISKELFHSFFVDELPVGHEEWPAFCSIDPSLGTGRDRSGICTWLEDPTGLPYLVDVFEGLIKPDDLLKEVYARHCRYNYKKVYWEMQVNKELWLDILRRELPIKGELPVQPVQRNPHRDSKPSRIHAFGRFLRNGYLRVWRRCAMLDRLEAQLYVWDRCAHDDVLDAASEIVRQTKPPKRAMPAREPTKQVLNLRMQQAAMAWMGQGGSDSPHLPGWA